MNSSNLSQIGGIEYFTKFMPIYLPYVILNMIGIFLGLIGISKNLSKDHKIFLIKKL